MLGCNSPEKTTQEIRVRFKSDPQSLHPITYDNAQAWQIVNLLYQSLLGPDYADNRIKPQLAASLPIIEQQDSISLFTYTVRDEATWDNGSPITGKDIAFSMKVMLAPLVNNERARYNYEFIKDIRLDEANPRKCTIVCKGYTPEMDLLTGDFFIIPSYLFDPQHLLDEFSVPQLIKDSQALANHPKIKAFNQQFNNEKFNRDPDLLRGSGGYVLKSWKTGQFLVLQKKDTWWASPIQLSNLTANVPTIRFQIIPDNTSALLALRNQQIDLIDNVSSVEFTKMLSDKQLAQAYQFFTPGTYDFTYMGINTRLSKFADQKTRQALAYLADVKSIIRATQSGYAAATIGVINPADKTLYNSNISPYVYNTEKAVSLLKEAGWQQENDQWVRWQEEEKIILRFSIAYKAGDTAHENSALIFQQAAAKLGIPVEMLPMEEGLLDKKMNAHDFDLFIENISGSPFSYNVKSLFHTLAAENGANYTGFGTAKSDALIEAINTSRDLQTKAKLLKEFQAEMHEESALIFLYFRKERLVISKRFSNLKVTGLQPGYDISAFTLVKP